MQGEPDPLEEPSLRSSEGSSGVEEVSQIGSSIDRLEYRLREAETATQATLDRILDENRNLQEKVANLEGRLDSVIASWTKYRTDIDTEESEAHRALAASYANFVDQFLYSLAMKSTTSMEASLRADAVARLMQKLCIELFGRADISEQRIRRILRMRATDDAAGPIRRAASQAEGIVAQSRRMAIRGFWEFDFVPGAPIDSRRQQPWARCDPSTPAQFVVSPAYVAGHITYCQQRVYTGTD
jgi:hypothetical protein